MCAEEHEPELVILDDIDEVVSLSSCGLWSGSMLSVWSRWPQMTLAAG